METFSALLTLCEGNPPVIGGFLSQRPLTWSFDFFFDVPLNKRLGKQSRRWWFETPSRSLWRHCGERTKFIHICSVKIPAAHKCTPGIYVYKFLWITLRKDLIYQIQVDDVFPSGHKGTPEERVNTIAYWLTSSYFLGGGLWKLESPCSK